MSASGYAEALFMEIHIGASESLKQKRSVVKHLTETARRRFGVSAAEVDHQDLWQRAGLGFAVVASSASHAEKVLDAVETFVWSHPEIEVLTRSRSCIEADGG